jgi:hypothetical protein
MKNHPRNFSRHHYESACSCRIDISLTFFSSSLNYQFNSSHALPYLVSTNFRDKNCGVWAVSPQISMRVLGVYQERLARVF